MFGKRNVEPNIINKSILDEDMSTTSDLQQHSLPSTNSRNHGSNHIAKIHKILFSRIDTEAIFKIPEDQLQLQIKELISEIITENKFYIGKEEQSRIVSGIIDDINGYGPLQILLSDDSITDIMVNGPESIYYEKKGKVHLSDVVFRDHHHLYNIVQKIVSRVGRRVDETNPLCDARLPDGSRVNIVLPPVAIDGCSLSIRKFPKHKINLTSLVKYGALSEEMASFLKIATIFRQNIIVSGGTGSGKTTLLNALSELIPDSERIVTIEDAAELQLMQAHVVRLETRPPNIEGNNEIKSRDLIRNALRMRPDRIICGEVRGAEAIDMLQAMNTGHDGSMCTLHANNTRETLIRLESMVMLAYPHISLQYIRQQIASSVNLIVYIKKLQDGVRRITKISEVIGIETSAIILQDLFYFESESDYTSGSVTGAFLSNNLRPKFLNKTHNSLKESNIASNLFSSSRT